MKTIVLCCCLCLWLAVFSGGTALMLRYENIAGSTGDAPAVWPAASRIERTPGRATLIMLAHPKCPCTLVSIEAFSALLAENTDRVTAHVLFLKPERAGADWTQTSLWRAAAAIPGASVSCDDTGAEAARFGSETSGDVLLYDAHGHLTFHGGLTAARGRTGPSLGQNALGALLAGIRPTQSTTPVFGCPLNSPQSCPTSIR